MLINILYLIPLVLFFSLKTLLKSPILINETVINKIAVSTKFPFGKQGFTYLIGYKDKKN